MTRFRPAVVWFLVLLVGGTATSIIDAILGVKIEPSWVRGIHQIVWMLWGMVLFIATPAEWR